MGVESSFSQLHSEVLSDGSQIQVEEATHGTTTCPSQASGVVHPRVQAVGPEHFAFLCVDCAKARSKIMLADFYGRVVLEPTTVEHNQADFDTAVKAVRDAMVQRHIKDVIVVIEMHRTLPRTDPARFRAAGFEVRIIHPYTTKQYRLPADPGNKTDDTDLSAIHRAAVNGFGLLEHEADPVSVQLQMLARHRRDLVRKRVIVQQQMSEHLQSFMPGYSACFADVFDSPIVFWVAKHLGFSPQRSLTPGWLV